MTVKDWTRFEKSNRREQSALQARDQDARDQDRQSRSLVRKHWQKVLERPAGTLGSLLPLVPLRKCQTLPIARPLPLYDSYLQTSTQTLIASLRRYFGSLLCFSRPAEYLGSLLFGYLSKTVYGDALAGLRRTEKEDPLPDK
jgi:hypothetical protein